jgi:multidrug efflux pump
MTSLAFGLGVLPLVLASGAGSASQRAIGTGVLGGMITGTALAVFFVPIFFVVVRGSSRAASGSASCTPRAKAQACPPAGPRETRYEPPMITSRLPLCLAAPRCWPAAP